MRNTISLSAFTYEIGVNVAWTITLHVKEEKTIENRKKNYIVETTQKEAFQQTCLNKSLSPYTYKNTDPYSEKDEHFTRGTKE